MNAVVTGASSGIGRALAIQLAATGTKVFLIARRQALLEDVAAAIHAQGGQAETLVLDVADTEVTVHRLRQLDAQHPIDLIIANAGVGVPPSLPASLPAYSWEAISGAFHINFCGAAATLTAVLPAMVARGRGHLVGIGSLASFGALPSSAAYCAPKAGLSMLLDCLRLDLRHTPITVTSVHAGFVRTDMVARSTHPMPQLLDTDDAARRILAAIEARQERLDFPQPLAVATRLFGRLPSGLRDRILSRF